MKFSLVFDNTGDSIPFNVIENHELFEFFVNKVNSESINSFSNKRLARQLDQNIRELHWAISKTNEVLYNLTKKSFIQHTNLENYLDQKFLNQTHADWVFSQSDIVNIDMLRYSSDKEQAQLGNQLHDMYPDEIRNIRLADAMTKLGYLYPYEEINLAVHRLESSFVEQNLEFSSEDKWKVFDNPFRNNMISNNDITNFSFNYTYVGRQYYNKFEYFDDELECLDHYNYETLEYSFQISLKKPQTIPYSVEFKTWAEDHNVDLITSQLPIANIPGLADNLFKYRKVLYHNLQKNNQCSIILN